MERSVATFGDTGKQADTGTRFRRAIISSPTIRKLWSHDAHGTEVDSFDRQDMERTSCTHKTVDYVFGNEGGDNTDRASRPSRSSYRRTIIARQRQSSPMKDGETWSRTDIAPTCMQQASTSREDSGVNKPQAHSPLSSPSGRRYPSKIVWIGQPTSRGERLYFRGFSRGKLCVKTNDCVVVKVQGSTAESIDLGFGVVRGLYEEPALGTGDDAKFARVQWMYTYSEIQRSAREKFARKFGASTRTEYDVFLSDHVDIVELGTIAHVVYVANDGMMSDASSAMREGDALHQCLLDALVQVRHSIDRDLSIPAFQALLCIRRNSVTGRLYPPMEYVSYRAQEELDNEVDALSIGSRVKICRFAYNLQKNTIELVEPSCLPSLLSLEGVVSAIRDDCKVMLEEMTKMLPAELEQEKLATVLRETETPIGLVRCLFELRSHPSTPRQEARSTDRSELLALTQRGRRRLFQQATQGKKTTVKQERYTKDERKRRRSSDGSQDSPASSDFEDLEIRRSRRKVVAEGPGDNSKHSRVGPSFQPSIPAFLGDHTSPNDRLRKDTLLFSASQHMHDISEVERFISLAKQPITGWRLSAHEALNFLARGEIHHRIDKAIASVEAKLFERRDRLDFFELNGHRYRCGDAVALITPDHEGLAYYARIRTIWRPVDGPLRFDAEWYWYPSQLPPNVREYSRDAYGPFVSKELLLSDHIDTHSVLNVAGPCIMLTYDAHREFGQVRITDRRTGDRVPVMMSRFFYYSRDKALAPLYSLRGE